MSASQASFGPQSLLRGRQLPFQTGNQVQGLSQRGGALEGALPSPTPMALGCWGSKGD